jgi:hypothetical protein
MARSITVEYEEAIKGIVSCEALISSPPGRQQQHINHVVEDLIAAQRVNGYWH